MSFNAVGTNRLNWFSKAKLLSSPWTDLKTASILTHFDITGSYQRYFEITYQYGHCTGDVGWLVVGNGLCPWERHGSSKWSSIRFSNITRKTNWNHFSKRFSFIKTRFQWLCYSRETLLQWTSDISDIPLLRSHRYKTLVKCNGRSWETFLPGAQLQKWWENERV